MKKAVKYFGVMAFVAIIGLFISGCPGSGGRYNPESDFEARPIEGGNAVEITKYVGDKWEVRIPQRIRNLPVTHIGDYAFSSKNLTSVTIPNSVTSIGYEAFCNNQLTSVTIPNSVTHIESEAFRANQLTSVTIPSGITEIRAGVFVDNQLTSVTIPDSVTHIWGGAFARNYELTSITIGANVELIYFTGNATNIAHWGSFGNNNDFLFSYYDYDEEAGTYTRPDADSDEWTKR